MIYFWDVFYINENNISKVISDLSMEQKEIISFCFFCEVDKFLIFPRFLPFHVFDLFNVVDILFLFLFFFLFFSLSFYLFHFFFILLCLPFMFSEVKNMSRMTVWFVIIFYSLLFFAIVSHFKVNYFVNIFVCQWHELIRLFGLFYGICSLVGLKHIYLSIYTFLSLSLSLLINVSINAVVCAINSFNITS